MSALWTEIIPQIAFKHDFLMHSLLAVSALHTAYINPEHRDLYCEQAVSHQNQASRLAQNEMMNANVSNADALFAFSITTMWYSFASHGLPQMEISRRPLQGAIQTINVLRGIRTIGPSVKDWTWKGVRILSFLSFLTPHYPLLPTQRHTRLRNATNAHYITAPRPPRETKSRKLPSSAGLQRPRTIDLLHQTPRLLLHHVGRLGARRRRKFRRRRKLFASLIPETRGHAPGRFRQSSHLAVGDPTAARICGAAGRVTCYTACAGGALVCASCAGEALLVDGGVG